VKEDNHLNEVGALNSFKPIFTRFG